MPATTEDAQHQVILEAARAVAGHKSVNTTVIYTARDLALAVEVARRIG